MKVYYVVSGSGYVGWKLIGEVGGDDNFDCVEEDYLEDGVKWKFIGDEDNMVFSKEEIDWVEYNKRNCWEGNIVEEIS